MALHVGAGHLAVMVYSAYRAVWAIRLHYWFALFLAILLLLLKIASLVVLLVLMLLLALMLVLSIFLVVVEEYR